MNFWLKLFAGGIFLLGAGVLSWLGRKKIKNWGAKVKTRLIASFDGSSLFKILETFFNEAAVLWFVFPLLDTIYAFRKKDENGPSTGLVAVSVGIAGLLFLFAAIFASLAEEEEEARVGFTMEKRKWRFSQLLSALPFW